jgi:Tol biopolymer transport system component
MGAVYKAEDEHLGIFVAVKENLFLSDEYTRQFQREANILASLHYQNLPRVGDYFAIPGQGQYLIMDFVEGEDLRQRIERVGSLKEKEVLTIGAYICDALSYLHSRTPTIVHRDIKPGNIKITPEGEVILVDFGLAKQMNEGQATTTGARAMTPGYSPPEQYGTARTDPRSDIYSLGATLYAALTGIIPEDGLARATGKAELTSIRQLQPKIDRRVAHTIERALEVEPEHRYQSAEEFKKALIDAGNMAYLTTPSRYLVTPPPPEAQTNQPDSEPGADGKVFTAAPFYTMQNAPIGKIKRRVPGVWIPASIILALTLGFLVISRFPPGGILAFANGPTETATLDSTLYTTLTGPTTSAVTASATAPAATIEPVAKVLPSPSDTPYVPLTATETPTSPVDAPFAGADLIAFSSDRTGMMQIWTMNTDGSYQKQLTNMPSGACQPAWSPDGKMIAFISPCNGKENEQYPNARIYTMNSDGTELKILPVSQVGDFDPAWSPDSKRIAFTSLRTGTAHIFVYNLRDLTIHEVSDTRFPDIQPCWSPDGKQLAFVRQMPYKHVWVMSDQGTTLYQLTIGGDSIDLWPNWSPDGQYLIFSRSMLDPVIPALEKVRIEDQNTGREVRILPTDQPDNTAPITEAVISPDGKWILYESWPDGRNHDIYLIDSEGKNRTRLTTDPGFDFSPAWKPHTP